MSEVRAHRRRGTRGVRHHLRLYRRGMHPQIDAEMENIDAFTTVPGRLHPHIKMEPDTIYIVSKPDARIEDVLSHEEMHRALNGLGEVEASFAYDDISRIEGAAERARRGGI